MLNDVDRLSIPRPTFDVRRSTQKIRTNCCPNRSVGHTKRFRSAVPILIRKADPSDRENVELLLAESDLTRVGLGENDSLVFVLEDADRILGCAAIETNGSDGLLRSLAVAPEARGRGLGKLLVAHIEGEALTRGIRRLYLLTTTAEGFFGKLGYRIMDHDQAPEVVRASAEFSVCSSAGATTMWRTV
jgi:amino-acid N-acetyltransferase